MAVRTVAVRLIANVTGYVAGMRQAQAVTAATAAQASTLRTGIRQAGASMAGVAASAGLMRGGLVNPVTAAAVATAGAAKAAIDWESAWAGVTKTVDGSAAQMERLESDLRAMAGELPASHAEIAAVAEAAGQLGVRVDDVAGFTRVMIDLGETTNLSAQQAAVGLARFSAIMGTSRDDTQRMGSTIVELGNNMETTEAEILEFSTRLAAAGKIAGLSEADVFAFAATLTSVGVEAEAGGTALSKTFTTIRDAVIDGSEKLDVFAEVAGTTAEEFAARFRADPADAITAFIEGLGRMNAAGQSTSEVFAALGLQDQRLMRALLSTAEAGDKLRNSIEMANDEWRENNALTEEAQRRYDTMAAQISAAFGRIQNAAIDFGAQVAPAIVTAIEAVAGLVSFLAEADRQIQEFGSEAGGDIPPKVMLGIVAEAFAEGRVFSGTVERVKEYRQEVHAASGATKMFARRGQEARESSEALAAGAMAAEAGVSALGIGAQLAADATERASEHLADYLDEIRGATDPVFALMNSLQAVEEAQSAYNEAVEEFGKSSPEAEAAALAIAEAVAGAEQSALDAGLSFEEFDRRLQSWVDRGLITAETADVIRGAVKEARGEAEDYQGDYRARLLLDNFREVTSRLDGVERRAIAATKQRTLRIDSSSAVTAARRAWNVVAAVGAIPSSKTVRIGFATSGRIPGVVHGGGEVMPGGRIRRFHSGGPVAGLGSDEVPAILQTGEVVLSRRQVDMLGRALSPVAGGPVFHGGGTAGGGFPISVVISGTGSAGRAEADRINYLLRQGELNIKAEAIAR